MKNSYNPMRLSHSSVKRTALSRMFVLWSCALLALNASAAIYRESGGVVVVEAEHFDVRTENTDNGHRWAIIPDEIGSPDTPADTGFANARGDKYMQALPD